MKIRHIKNLPVFDRESARIIGQVKKAVIGDDYRLAYLVLETDSGSGMVLRRDLEIGEAAVTIAASQCIKSYAAGEELSIYQKKLGDVVFDREGKELGIVSDFILAPDNLKVWGVEISSGAISDILLGRAGIPLEQVNWSSPDSAVLVDEGSKSDDH